MEAATATTIPPSPSPPSARSLSPAPSIAATIEAPTATASLTDAPAMEAPPTNAPPTNAPATNAPATNAPAMGAPAMGAPAMEAPAMEAPAMGAPAMGAPAMEAPAMEAPAMGAPAMGAPAMEAPAMEAPAMGAPAMEAPAMGAPAMEAPAMGAPAMEASPTDAPAMDAPATTRMVDVPTVAAATDAPTAAKMVDAPTAIVSPRRVSTATTTNVPSAAATLDAPTAATDDDVESTGTSVRRPSAPRSSGPRWQSPHEALVSPARSNEANAIVSPRRSPRIVQQRSSISFRELLRGDYDADSGVAHGAPAAPASSGVRRQSSRPATVAARSRVDLSHIDDLYAEAEDDCVGDAEDDDVYMEEEGDDDDDGHTDEDASNSTTRKRRGKATRDTRHSRRNGFEDGGEYTDTTSTSLSSVQSQPRTFVLVPEPQEYHADWEAWDAYFKVYCKMTHQKIVVEETKRRQWRLERIYSSKAYLELAAENREDEHPLPPEKFDVFQRTYVCTHGGSTRKSRGKNRRVRRHLRYYACPFRFVVQVVQDEDEDSPWCLQVRLGRFEHNHPVSREVFRTYPEERGVLSDTNAQQVDTMLDVRAKRSKIYDFLLSRGENVTKRDVDNLVAHHRTRVSTADDNEATAIQLAEFTADDPNNLVTVDESHRGHSAVISITTSLMRATYVRFPELLLVDCTHKTNRYNYQLCTLMVVDERGEGVVVQHSLFETNSDWHMEAALAHFVRAHPSAEKSLRVIVVDKDLNEIRVLRSRFTEARILICAFHVIKYFSVAVKKPEFGSISPEDREGVEHLLKNLVYASTLEEYEQERRSLKLLCERVHFSEFYDYFERNWDSCRPMWVKYLRKKLPYFRVDTNNHLESFFGKIKGSVSPDMSMSECLRELIAKERTRQNDYNHLTNRVGTYVNRNFDDELATVLRFTTHFVAEHVAKEYDIGRSKAAEYTYVEAGDQIKVQGVKYTNEVNRHTWSCTCDFASAMVLPCRHSIAARVYLGVKPVIPLDRIGVRWTRLQAPLPRARQFTYNSYEARVRAASQRSVRERYNEAMRQLQPLCSELAEISDEEEFEASVKFVQDAWMNARMRARVKVATTERDVSKTTPTDQEDASDDEPPTQASTGISLTQNSLFSEEVGHLPIVDPATVALPRPVSDLAVSQTQPSEPDDDDDDFEPLPKRPKPNVNIKLNPRATRPGRPKSSRAQDEAETRQSRQVFNDTMKARRALGEITMKQLLESLDEEKPGLAELKRRLEVISVRHLDYERGKVEFVKKPRSAMVNDAFYTLPRATIEKCFKVLPLSNTAEDAISISSQTYSQEATDPRAVVEGVKVGSGRHTLFYSRTTVEVMHRVNLMKDAADDGLALARWLEREVATAVPSALQRDVRELAEQVSTRYPAGTIEGFDSDYHYSMLPCVKPPEWFNDGFIRAFCDRLSEKWSTFKTTRVLLLESPDKKRTRSSPLTPYKLSSEIEKEIQAYASDESVKLIGIPVCFGNKHWCCMVLDKSKCLVSTYDSLGFASTQRIMGILAEKLDTVVPATSFTVQRVNTPVQSDGYSCGFFVCYKFWRLLDATVSRDLSSTGQLCLRFQMLKLIVRGSAPRSDVDKC